MEPIDGLSRDRTPLEFDTETLIKTTSDSVTDELLSPCSPGSDVEGDLPSCLDHVTLMKKVVSLTKRVL